MELFNPTNQLYVPLPLRISSIGRFNNVPQMIVFDGSPEFTASQAWPAVNRAHYMPVTLPSRFTVARFVVAVGTTAGGNIDVGLYDSAGNRLLSTGTVARGSVSTIQYLDVTDQSFPAGKYYLALVCSSTGVGFTRVQVDNTDNFKAVGLLQEDLGSTVLPATMTPVAFSTDTAFWFGFTQSATL